MKSIKEIYMDHESFIMRWNRKAESYQSSSDPLCATFDEFMTRFIIYNILYKLCAEKLSRPNVGDKTKATDIVYEVLVTNLDDVILSMDSDIRKMHDYIIESQFAIHTNAKNRTAEDAKMLKKMVSSDSGEKLWATLLCIYKIRCNLFHGEKEYLEKQLPLLSIANNCLKILNDKICEELRK